MTRNSPLIESLTASINKALDVYAHQNAAAAEKVSAGIRLISYAQRGFLRAKEQTDAEFLRAAEAHTAKSGEYFVFLRRAGAGAFGLNEDGVKSSFEDTTAAAAQPNAASGTGVRLSVQESRKRMLKQLDLSFKRLAGNAEASQPTPSSMNTMITYQYRDGSNCKTSNSVIFRGTATPKQLKVFSEGLIASDGDSYGDFIPGQVGLRDLQDGMPQLTIDLISKIVDENDGPMQLSSQDRERFIDIREELKNNKPIWDPEQDHPLHEVIHVHQVNKQPSEMQSFSEFIDVIAKTRWDFEYKPANYSAMAKNFLERQLSNEVDGGLEPDL